MELPSRCPSEQRYQHFLREPGDFPDGRDPVDAQLPRGDDADAPQPLHRELVKEHELALARHDEQPVRLRHAARDLREELRAGDADRQRKADTLAHLAPQPHGDARRTADTALHAAHVEERLVDRQPLDERRRVVEHLEHRLARRGVRVEAGAHDGRVRAQAQGRPVAHRRADPAGLRLVTRREHDTHAHDHRPAAQAGVVPLLDRGEECIEIGVENRHEHMFAHRTRRYGCMQIGSRGEPVTRISRAAPDRVEVRGRDLAGDLMGRVGFTEYFHLLLTGRRRATISGSSSICCWSRSPSTG